MKTKMKYLASICMLFVCTVLSAQSTIENSSTSSAVVVRDPARQSSTETDAVLYNPAGTAFAKEGLSLSVSGIANIGNPQIYNYSEQVNHKISENAFAPSIQVVYKTNKWAFSGSFASEGGYKRKYKEGSPFDDAINSVKFKYNEVLNRAMQDFTSVWEVLETLGYLPSVGMSSDDEIRFNHQTFKSHLYNKTFRFGAAYRITDNVSAFAGLKLSNVSYEYVSSMGVNVFNKKTGEVTTAEDYFDNVLKLSENISDNDHRETVQNIAQAGKAYARDVEADNYTGTSESGWSVAPVLGLDYKTRVFNVGISYDFSSHFDAEDGRCIATPARLAMGGNWQTTQWLNIAIGGDLYFKPTCDQSYFNFNCSTYWDASLSTTFTCSKSLKANIGWQIGKQYPLNEDFYLIHGQVKPSKYIYPSKFSVGIRYAFSERISADLGVAMWIKGDIGSNNNITVNVNDSQYSLSNTTIYRQNTAMQIALGLNYNL